MGLLWGKSVDAPLELLNTARQALDNGATIFIVTAPVGPDRKGVDGKLAGFIASIERLTWKLDLVGPGQTPKQVTLFFRPMYPPLD